MATWGSDRAQGSRSDTWQRTHEGALPEVLLAIKPSAIKKPAVMPALLSAATPKRGAKRTYFFFLAAFFLAGAFFLAAAFFLAGAFFFLAAGFF